MADNDNEKNRRIKSVEVGFSILRVISENKSPMNLSELSNKTRLHKSQLYRYLNSFIHLGVLVRNNEENAKWVLGPELIALGSVAIDSLDLTKEAIPYLIELKNKLNETVALSIWRENGPFFVHWEKGNKLVNIGLDTGSYVPLYTATGKIFRSYLPEDKTKAIYEKEVAAGNIQPMEYTVEIERVRREGLSFTKSSLISGIVAVSTPIFFSSSKLAGALSIIGVSSMVDFTPTSFSVQELVQTGRDISRRLGYNGTYPFQLH